MQLYLSDERDHARFESKPLGAKMWPAPHAVTPPAANSNLEKLAMWSDRLTDRSNKAAGILLAASTFTANDEFTALQPLWAEEAMHRAYSMLRLFHSSQNFWHCEGLAVQHADCCIATRLSRNLLALQANQLQVRVPCSRILTQTVRDLVLLFGRGAGEICLAAHTDRLTLSTYRRRALVLLAIELVSNALTHAFPDRGFGFIQVGLKFVSPRLVELHVADSGIGMGTATLNSACSVAGGLSALLGGDLRYCSTSVWSTRAELRFPLDEL